MKPLSFLVLFVLLCACNGRECPSPSVPNAVYYWKTVFDVGDAEVEFMNRHGVSRIYLRMFDVSVDQTDSDDRTVPNASVQFPSSGTDYMEGALRKCTFIPVVYITLEAMKESRGHEARLAENIVTRVKNMCSYNEIPNVEGLQLDCDWTRSTESSFFLLCDCVRQEINRQHLRWKLSSTIRLHQLASKAPPVDYGVLMVYNTGNFADPDAKNSILNRDDVLPYIKHLQGYPLRLDVAYPTYSWQLLFRSRTFLGLMNGVEVSDTALFAPQVEGKYVAKEDLSHGETVILRGDVVRCEQSSCEEITSVKAAIDKALRNKPHGTVLYHLDMKNLSKYTRDEINSFFPVPSQD